MKAIDQYTTERYTLINGDTTEIITSLPDNSIGMSVFSPPFSSLYTVEKIDVHNVRLMSKGVLLRTETIFRQIGEQVN